LFNFFSPLIHLFPLFFFSRKKSSRASSPAPAPVKATAKPATPRQDPPIPSASPRVQEKHSTSSDSESEPSKKSEGKKRSSDGSSSRSKSGSNSGSGSESESESQEENPPEEQEEKSETPSEPSQFDSDAESEGDFNVQFESKLKRDFVNFPEPVVIEKAVASTAELEDPELKRLNSTITVLRQHIRKIQEEEARILRKFAADIPAFTSSSDDDKVISKFKEDLEKIRQQRRQYRSLLWDAREERHLYLEAIDNRNKVETLNDRQVSNSIGSSTHSALTCKCFFFFFEQLESYGARKGVDLFLILFLFWQMVIFVMYVVFFDHRFYQIMTENNTGTSENITSPLAFFTSISFIIFLGFGLFRSHLKKLSFSGFGQTFFIAAYSIEFGIMMLGFWSYYDLGGLKKVHIDIPFLIQGLYAAAAVLVTYGAVLGRVNFPQLFILATVEIAFYSLNHWLGLVHLDIVNPGMSIFVHVFGAICGAVFAFLFSIGASKPPADHQTRYNGEIFSLLGMLVMWVFWPAFNSATADAGAQLQSACNTVIAQLASTVAGASISRMWGRGYFNIEEIKIAALSGGIMMGSAANLLAPIYVPIIVGTIAGVIAIFTIKTRRYWEKIHFEDTAAVISLHGVNGFLSSILGIAITARYDNGAEEDYLGESLNGILNGETKEAAANQVYSLLFSLGTGAAAGLVAVFLVRVLDRWLGNRTALDFSDQKEFRLTEDFPSSAITFKVGADVHESVEMIDR
jgi:ammonium transporter Rh